MIKLAKNVLYRYSVSEDIANAVSHGVAAIASYIGLIYLVYVAATRGNIADVIAFSIYGTTLIVLFMMSTLYHSIFHDMTRSIFKRLDHSAIFLLIAGTYVPFTVTVLQTTVSYVILAILVLIAAAGIVLKVIYIGRFKKLGTLIYILMGWIVIFEIKPLIANLNSNALIFFIIGGIIYSVGAILYAFSKFKFHHFIWHLFVVLAAACHYIVIALYLLPSN